MCPTNRGDKKKEKQKYTKSNLIHNSMPRDINVVYIYIVKESIIRSSVLIGQIFLFCS